MPPTVTPVTVKLTLFNSSDVPKNGKFVAPVHGAEIATSPGTVIVNERLDEVTLALRPVPCKSMRPAVVPETVPVITTSGEPPRRVLNAGMSMNNPLLWSFVPVPRALTVKPVLLGVTVAPRAAK